MIIECINCNKKFNVDASLIPNDGREIQCGSCNYIWFFTNNSKKLDKTEVKKQNAPNDKETKNFNDNKDNNIKSNHKIQSPVFEKKNPSIQETKIITVNKNKENLVPINKVNIVNKFFSYLIVFIISFIGLIILIDTLKTPLINYFPKLEIFLFNLFETLKDIKLFIIDLI